MTGSFRLGSLLLAGSSVGLAFGAGALGPGTPAGAALGVGALGMIAAGVAGRLRGGAPTADPATRFLERALAADSLDAIAREFRMAVRAQVGASTAVLIAPAPDGQIVALGASDARVVDGESAAFDWLADQRQPVNRADLAARGDASGPAAVRALLDELSGDVVLPLVHRGVLLGLGVIGGARVAPEDADVFYRAMRATTTAAIANTYLDAEARGGSRLARTFDLATAMQESLMPDDRVVRRPTFELRGLFVPVAECGGDLWSWRELGRGRLLLVIADATGHGAAPALLAAVAKGAIDAHWQLMGADLDPGRLLAALNRAIYRAGRTRYMMTAFAAVLDKAAGEVRYANAAQNFPFFIAGDEAKVEVLVARGNTLGAAPEAAYETHRRPMAMGDKLVLYTDGLVDAASPDKGPFGERRLRAAIQAMAHERATRIPELLMAEIDRYTGGNALDDDVTVCAAEFGPTDEGGRA